MAITGPSPAYTGSIDLVWVAPGRFRLERTTPSFHQVRFTDGSALYERNDGDFEPRWLDDLTSALFDPVPPQLIAAGAAHVSDPHPATGMSLGDCFNRDDRPGNITDQLTWGRVCFWPGPLLQYVLAFNRFLDFKDFRDFHGQQIPYTFSTDVLAHQAVVAHVTVMEALDAPSPHLLDIPSPTPAADQIHTAFVSTLKEESLVDHPPAIEWPTVREGKTEGYMIVYARTDRTGQVRETAKHNSDNPGLEDFGMQAALRYKFHPLLVDGVPQQMEMPLVLHFTSRIADAVPLLTDSQTRALMHGCSLPRAKPGKAPFRVEVSVTPDGKLAGERFPDANTPNAPHRSPYQFATSRCSFSPYVLNGKATYYHGELWLPTE